VQIEHLRDDEDEKEEQALKSLAAKRPAPVSGAGGDKRQKPEPSLSAAKPAPAKPSQQTPSHSAVKPAQIKVSQQTPAGKPAAKTPQTTDAKQPAGAKTPVVDKPKVWRISLLFIPTNFVLVRTDRQ